MSDFYTWADLKAAVLELLPLDKSRLIQGDEDQTYLEKLMRQAVLDLQDFIPQFRTNHETIYLPGDFVTEGRASRAVLPPQAQLRDCWLYDSRNSNNQTSNSNLECSSRASHKVEHRRHPVMRQWPWEKRFDLTGDLVRCARPEGLVDWPYIVQNVPLPAGAFQHRGSAHGLMSCDPYGYTFYVYPEVCDGWIFSVFWDGLKGEFQDTEETPFHNRAAHAIAEFVRGKLARDVDHDMAAYESYFRAHPTNPGSYVQSRKNLYLREKARTQG